MKSEIMKFVKYLMYKCTALHKIFHNLQWAVRQYAGKINKLFDE